MYKTFMKHAEKITKSPVVEQRKILQGVKHYGEGSAAVTDSHRLYVAEDIHELQGEPVLTPSGKEIEGAYPAIARLIPTQVPEFTGTLQVDELIKATDIMVTAAKAVGEDPVMSLAENILFFDSDEVKASYELSIDDVGMNIWSNAQYWLDAVRMFKAFKYKEVELKLYDKMRPFTLESPDKKLMALILPVRRR